jgi:hypothetical protein
VKDLSDSIVLTASQVFCTFCPFHYIAVMCFYKCTIFLGQYANLLINKILWGLDPEDTNSRSMG